MKQKKLHLLALIITVSAFTLSAQTYKESAPKLRIGFSGGIGYKTAKVPENELIVNQDKYKEFSDRLRRTPMVGVSAHYLFKAGFGLGAKYSYSYSSSEIEDLIIDDKSTNHNLVADAFERMHINFVGFSFCGYLFLGENQKFMLYDALAFGYTHLRDESGMLFNNMLITGKTPGFDFEIGVEYFLSPSISLGINGGYFGSTFTKVVQSDGTHSISRKLQGDEVLNANNYNLNAGIRYYLNK